MYGRLARVCLVKAGEALCVYTHQLVDVVGCTQAPSVLAAAAAMRAML